MKRLEKPQLWYSYFESAAGGIFIALGVNGITDLFFSGDGEEFIGKMESKHGVTPSFDSARLRPVLNELERYFKGRPAGFNFPLDPAGTGFERSVWASIRKIPWGKTRSYKWVAALAGAPGGARAAGGACGKNPVPLIIPCHRVLKEDGEIGGYTGGLELKRTLLRIEGIELP